MSCLLDTDRNRISCHESSILRFGDTFYWYGTSYVGNPDGLYGIAGHKLLNGFNVYTSTDLINWKYGGVCLDFRGENDVIQGTAHRPNVLFNDRTKTYVMWFFDFVKYPDPMLRVAVSKTPTGPFKIIGARMTGAPHGYGQDLGLFQDEDGKGYLVYDDGARNLRVDLLSEDYLESTGKSVVALGPKHEGSAMVKFKGKYIVAGSGVCGWGVSETDYAVADFPLGPYSEMRQMSDQDTWSSQISNFLHVRETDTVIAICDRWWWGQNGRHDLEKSPCLFLPVCLNPDTGEARLECPES